MGLEESFAVVGLLCAFWFFCCCCWASLSFWSFLEQDHVRRVGQWQSETVIGTHWAFFLSLPSLMPKMDTIMGNFLILFKAQVQDANFEPPRLRVVVL